LRPPQQHDEGASDHGFDLVLGAEVLYADRDALPVAALVQELVRRPQRVGVQAGNSGAGAAHAGEPGGGLSSGANSKELPAGERALRQVDRGGRALLVGLARRQPLVAAARALAAAGMAVRESLVELRGAAGGESGGKATGDASSSSGAHFADRTPINRAVRTTVGDSEGDCYTQLRVVEARWPVRESEIAATAESQT
jgi:hypothetical protein